MDASTARRAPDVPVRGRPPAQQRSAHTAVQHRSADSTLSTPPLQPKMCPGRGSHPKAADQSATSVWNSKDINQNGGAVTASLPHQQLTL